MTYAEAVAIGNRHLELLKKQDHFELVTGSRLVADNRMGLSRQRAYLAESFRRVRDGDDFVRLWVVDVELLLGNIDTDVHGL